MLAMTSYAISQPWRQTLLLISGVRTGDAILLAFILLGMGTLVEHYAFWFYLIEKAGALYLLWIGILACITQKPLAERKVTLKNTTAFLAGFSTGIANPKALLLYITVLPAMLDIANLGAAQIFYAWVIMIATYTLTSIVLYGSASKTRAFLKNDTWRNYFQKTMGAIMIMVALFALFVR